MQNWSLSNSDELNEEDYLKTRPYKSIPKYTDKEMESAVVVDNEDLIRYYLSRQALNGYVGVYKDNWIVGRNNLGKIIKVQVERYQAIMCRRLDEISSAISYTQNHALLGGDLKGELFCKLTYDKAYQDFYATHVDLVNEYIEAQVINDGGKYGGLHFIPMSKFEACLEHNKTYYGNKIAIITPIEDEVYYEYKDNLFIGDKVYVSKVMYLNKVKTWIELSKMTTVIKEKKVVICDYLKDLENDLCLEKYGDCIEYLKKL